ncbi:MAG: hypothetical protein KDM64_13880, partial [Verrucomicrobiae bacterium]|nr:hypothetical protein [Verrucomicrobiae bacterium]
DEWLNLAFDPQNWNWQLAWLDPAYEQAMPQGKFERSHLSDAELTRLEAGEKLVQAVLFWDMLCPAQGQTAIAPDMVIDFQVEGMDFLDVRGIPTPIGWREKPSFGSSGPGVTAWGSNRTMDYRFSFLRGGPLFHDFFQRAGTELPGSKAFEFPLLSELEIPNDLNNPQLEGRTTPLDRNVGQAARCQRYSYVTKPFKVGDLVRMEAGKVLARIYSAGGKTPDAAEASPSDLTERSASQTEHPELVQELEIPFPSFSVEAPELAEGLHGWTDEYNQERRRLGPMHFWSLGWDGPNPHVASTGRMALVKELTLQSKFWSLFANWLPKDRPLLAVDVIQSVGIGHADSRMVAAKGRVKEEDGIFQPHRDYGVRRSAHSLLVSAVLWTKAKDQDVLVPDLKKVGSWRALRLPSMDGSETQRYGDFDSGLSMDFDGPYINRPDEGNGHFLMDRAFPDDWRDYFDRSQLAFQLPTYHDPYFTPGGSRVVLPGFRTPNRMISSAGMLGSLPVGSTRNQPWRTLLFRPNVVGGRYESHPGAGNRSSLPDHLWMDLFWMPVVEPYAISEAFSTAGKVNLNYQMLPFRHVRRDTALRGVLKPGLMTCIPNKWVGDYKMGVGHGTKFHWRDNPFGGTLENRSLMSALVLDETLSQFDKRF